MPVFLFTSRIIGDRSLIVQTEVPRTSFRAAPFGIMLDALDFPV